jgi:hypothetical protein
MVRCPRQSKHLKGQIEPKQPTENRLHTNHSKQRWSSPSMIICKPVIGNTSCCPDDTPIRAIRRAARPRRVRQTGGFVLTAYSEESFSPSRRRSGNGSNTALVVEVQPLTPPSPSGKLPCCLRSLGCIRRETIIVVLRVACWSFLDGALDAKGSPLAKYHLSMCRPEYVRELPNQRGARDFAI